MPVERKSTFRTCVIRAATIAVGGIALALGVTAAPANDFHISSAYGDANGNLVMRGRGGEKIIIVGGAGKANILAKQIGRAVPVAARASGPQVSGPPLDPHVVKLIDTRSDACNAPVVLRGRSFMYGIDRNVTPGLGQPGC